MLQKLKGSFCFKREERLTGKDKIKEVFSKGKRTGCRGAKLFVLKNNLSQNRVCFTFPKGFAGAAERNRTKRLGREAYRNLKPCIKKGYDIVFIVYPGNPEITFEGRLKQLRYLFNGAGLLQ